MDDQRLILGGLGFCNRSLCDRRDQRRLQAFNVVGNQTSIHALSRSQN